MGCKLSPTHILDMLHRIEIRRHRGPVNALDIFSFKEVVDNGHKVCTCIIIHEYNLGLTASRNRWTQNSSISSLYLTEVTDSVSKMWRSVRPSSIMPSNTMTSPEWKLCLSFMFFQMKSISAFSLWNLYQMKTIGRKVQKHGNFVKQVMIFYILQNK